MDQWTKTKKMDGIKKAKRKLKTTEPEQKPEKTELEKPQAKRVKPDLWYNPVNDSIYKTVTINIGDFYDKKSTGFTLANLEKIAKRFKNTTIFNLLDYIEDEETKQKVDGEPYLLLIRDGVNQISENLTSEILTEQLALEPLTNKEYFNQKKKRVEKKHARHHMTFADKDIEPDYPNGVSRQISLTQIPKTKKYMNHIVTMLAEMFPEKKLAEFLEVNYYPKNKGGIGFHGDTERKIAISARFGTKAPMVFQWYHKAKILGKMFRFEVNSGDFYIMAEKTTGYDWRYSSKYTLRHAAVGEKYMTVSKKNKP